MWLKEERKQLAQVWYWYIWYSEHLVFQLSIITTRWHRSASFVKVIVFTGKNNMQCNMHNWDSFKTINQTADSLWAVIMTTRCH